MDATQMQRALDAYFDRALPVLVERTIKILRDRGVLPPEPPELAAHRIAVDEQISERTGWLPSGLDSREKWDASGRPYRCGPPTRVVDKLTTDETRVVER